MNSIGGKMKRLLFSTSYKRFLFAGVTIAAALLIAFFSQKVVFFSNNDSASAYKIEYYNTNDELPQKVDLDIDYNGETIRIVKNDTFADEDISIYGSSRFGGVKLTEENMKNIDETFLGNFIAALPREEYDIDNDGKDEKIYRYVKTDIRSAQSNSGETTMLRDKNVGLEIGMDSFSQLFVHYQTKILAEREVTVYLSDGTSFNCTTDETGRIPELSVNQIREGVTVEYAPNGLNLYISRYVPETNSAFSGALISIGVIAILTVASIVFCVLLRSIMKGKKHKKGLSLKKKLRPKYKPAFVIIRWCIMLVSFFLLTWGGSWLGLWFEELYIPVLSCSKYNPEQIVASSCYYMSHLNVLFTLSLKEIVVFFACFFVPLFIFGKLFCGFVCPMGLVQDVMNAARQKTGVEGITFTERLYERMAIIKWTVVLLFLGMGFAGLDFCNICPAVTLSPAFSGFKTTIYISGFVMLFVLVGSFFKSRFFCNICPLGLLMGLFNKFTLVRLKKDCTACTECGACYNACPMGIKTIYTERGKANVTNINCIMCGECIRNCPEDNALKITLAGKPICTSSREKFMKRFKKKEEKNERTDETSS